MSEVIEITQEQFQAYVDVQMSGVTNMWDIAYVCSLSNGLLEEADCLYIMKHYGELKERYEVVI